MSDIIDLGTISVPTSWNEITLKKYQLIEEYYSDKDKKFDVREIIHILIDRPIDYVNSLPIEFLEDIMDKLSFLQTQPEEKKPTNTIIIDGERYTVHTENKLKVGEYIAADTAMKDDKHNYAAILAILCRKDGEVYDSRFENEVLEDRIKMWEQVPVIDVLPIVRFFLSVYITFQMPSLLSSKVKEALDLTRRGIKTLRKNGDLSMFSTKRVMMKLRKLEKSINTI